MKMRLSVFTYILFLVLAVGSLARFRHRDVTENRHITSRNSSPDSLKSESPNVEKHPRDDKQSTFAPTHLKNGGIFSEKKAVTRAEEPVNGIPGVDSRKLKEKMYNLLGKIRTHPEAAIYTLLTGEVPQEHVDKYGTGMRRRDTPDNEFSSEMLKQLLEKIHASSSKDKKTRRKSRREKMSKSSLQHQRPAKTPEEVTEGPETLSRARRSSKGVMYLPINHAQPDPCAPPKGSKLMEALPLVFLSTILSVADAVGNVINNINSNNNNNNNNNDNNVNNDNTNLGANVNNANQINVVPLGGRALRIARAIMNSIGRMAMGVYEAVVPSALWGTDTTGEVGTDTGQLEPGTGRVLRNPAAEKTGDVSVAVNRSSDDLPSAKRHSIVKRQDTEVFKHQDLFSTSNLTPTAEKLSNYRTHSNGRNVSLLFDDAEMHHLITSCTGKDGKPVDAHLLHSELSKAERVFQLYLDKLRGYIPSLVSEK